MAAYALKEQTFSLHCYNQNQESLNFLQKQFRRVFQAKKSTVNSSIRGQVFQGQV